MSKKILIADDDRFMREMLKALLTQAGYDVILAEDGQSAVEMAKKESPDLILMDGLMPRMHGFLACKAIKGQAAPPKVIIFSAVYTKPSYKWEVKNVYSADDMLVKPFKNAELLACIQKHLPDGRDLSSLTALVEKRAQEEIRPVQAA